MVTFNAATIQRLAVSKVKYTIHTYQDCNLFQHSTLIRGHDSIQAISLLGKGKNLQVNPDYGAIQRLAVSQLKYTIFCQTLTPLATLTSNLWIRPNQGN